MAQTIRIQRSLLAASFAGLFGVAMGLFAWLAMAGRLHWPRMGPAGVGVAVGVAGVVVGLAIVRYLQRQWLAPLESMTRALGRMADGEWQTRVEPRGADALHAFAKRLNAVASQAQRQLSDLQNQRADLQRLVDTLPDPILACDAQGRIILTNFPAATLLQVSPAQALRQRMVNVVTDAPILELFDLLQKTPIPAAPHNSDPLPIQQEIRLFRGGQRLIYQALAARTLDKGVLLVFRDVSRLTGATQMKADFVANASHELRTPIAAIKIAFETLRDVLAENDLDQADRCLAIIDGHLHRLEEMLRDLLDLSRVESPMLETDARPVSTSELFANLRATLGPMARQKNVALQLDETSVPQFSSDARLLNLILKNLVENSLKFTPAGGSVCVKVAAAPDEQVALMVADTGIGIAPEHVDRVFERFYQVDAARSGSAGRGTGLGLAIVKHAVLAMKGHITLQSVPGKGTTVTCRFPQGDGVLAGEERH